MPDIPALSTHHDHVIDIDVPELPHVLIVEDDPRLHRLLVECLQPEYTTESAFDGETALLLALESIPDLVIVDLVLPRVDGASLIRELRKHPEMNTVPIVVVTGTVENEKVAALLERGAQDFLHKPFAIAELRARVRNLITAKRTRDVLNETIGRHETDLVKLATEVARRQSELEHVLQDLEKARLHAELAGRVKSNFLRMMSHELRTPVTAMHLHLRMIEREAAVRSLPAVRDGLDAVARSTRRLTHLVDTVLEWARIESGRCRIVVEQFQLVQLVTEVVEEAQGYARQKALSLQVEAPSPPLPALQSDRRLVRLLLVDLVTRAIQSTDQGSVMIMLRGTRDYQQISFRDGGPALTQEQHVELFEPLRHTEDLAQRSGVGSGLGLQVTRDLAHAVEGDVTLEPHDGTGNVFTLTLPLLPLGTRSLIPGDPGSSEITH